MATQEKTTRHANKDEVELQKIFMELPKIGVTMVAFFATASALILRLAPNDTGSPDLWLKFVYLVGVVVTVLMFWKSYNYLAKIVDNVTTEAEDEGRALQISALKQRDYTLLKSFITCTVVGWVLILCLFVFAA